LRQVVLLRGINLGARNRIPMPALRSALEEAGFDEVETYVQSGNVVLRSGSDPEQTASRCREVIAASFGLDIPVIVRSGPELGEVVQRNPLPEAAQTPKLFQVGFLSEALPDERVQRLAELALSSERFVAVGREVYAWHPEGIARSKLASGLAGPRLGVTLTARNWTTVTTLLAMVEDGDGG
jgi:uncharacterized protein (DUF1697 family)